MTIDLNRLKSMTKDELIDIARQVNAPHHHANKPETIIESIINTVMQTTLNTNTPDKQKQGAEKPKDVAVFLTEEELEQALAPIKAKYPAFSTHYDHECRCVSLRYNDGRHKHAETMSLSCSKTKFLRKAQEIARGPLMPRALKKEDFGAYGAKPQNAYTETVLAG